LMYPSLLDTAPWPSLSLQPPRDIAQQMMAAMKKHDFDERLRSSMKSDAVAVWLVVMNRRCIGVLHSSSPAAVQLPQTRARQLWVVVRCGLSCAASEVFPEEPQKTLLGIQGLESVAQAVRRISDHRTAK